MSAAKRTKVSPHMGDDSSSDNPRTKALLSLLEEGNIQLKCSDGNVKVQAGGMRHPQAWKI
jgi:hypothetical protein